MTEVKSAFMEPSGWHNSKISMVARAAASRNRFISPDALFPLGRTQLSAEQLQIGLRNLSYH
jgi:hypothetical protein